MLVGSFQKIGMWIGIIVANQIDIMLFGNTPVAKMGATFFFLGMEGGSIVENLGALGVKLPKVVTDNMEVLKQKGEVDVVQHVDEIKLKVDDQEVKIKTKE